MRIQPKFLLVGVLVLLVGVFALTYLSPENRAGTKNPVSNVPKGGITRGVSLPLKIGPPVSWAPDHLTVTLAPGESKQVTVTANLSANVAASAVWVVPPLAPYVTISPTTLPALNGGSSQILTLTFQVATSTPFQTIDGTLHLRVGSSTIARPLPIKLNVWLASEVEIPGALVRFNYPPTWSIAESPNMVLLESPSESDLTPCESDSPDACAAESPPSVTIAIRENPSSLSLRDFVNSYQNGWYAIYDNVSSQTVNGAEAIVANDAASAGQHWPVVAAFIRGPSFVVVATAFSTDDINSFFAILATLRAD